MASVDILSVCISFSSCLIDVDCHDLEIKVRSLEIPPVDISCRSSYWRSIVSMAYHFPDKPKTIGLLVESRSHSTLPRAWSPSEYTVGLCLIWKKYNGNYQAVKKVKNAFIIIIINLLVIQGHWKWHRSISYQSAYHFRVV